MVRAHPTDSLLLVLVIISVIIMIIFEAYSQPSDSNVRCIMPGNLDTVQEGWVQRACSGYIWSHKNRVNYNNKYMPLPGDNQKLKVEATGAMSDIPKPLELYYWFIIELVIIVAGYLLTRLVILCLSSSEMVLNHVIRTSMNARRDESIENLDSIPEKHDMTENAKDGMAAIAGGRLIFLLYIIVELLLMLIWFGLAGKAVVLHSERQEIAEADPNNVMCEFHISKLGSNARYTTQCQLPDMHQVAFVAMANVALCFTVAILLLIHVLYTLIFAPFLCKGPLDPLLRQAEIKPMSAAFSNLTLLLMLYDSHNPFSYY